MSDYSEFFLSSPPETAQLDLLEITHPNFSQTYRLVRNHPENGGVTVMHEGAVGPFAYTYMPMRIKAIGSTTNLDQELEVTLGDLGLVIPTEIQAITDANGFRTKPLLKYRTYRSDDLTAPIYGPVTLRIDGVTLTKEGCAFRAKSASLNRVRTGETYDLLRFPMLGPLA